MVGASAIVETVPMARRQRAMPGRWRKTYLREWRDHAGLSQEEAAEGMEIGRSQLSKVENGHHPYTQEILEKAAKKYGCTETDLLTRPPSEGETLFGLWPELSDQEKRQIVRMIHALLDN